MHRKTFTPTLMILGLVACGDSEDGKPPPQVAPTLPTQPETFRIALSGSPCYGDCPTYSTSIDQDGNVVYIGERCVARPGVFEHKVPAEDARAVYDALSASKYASLGDRYVDKDDGCNVATDAPTFTWNVQADDYEKPLLRYAGCLGVDALDEIDAVMPLLQERADVLGYLEPSLFNCRSQEAAVFEVSLRLSHGEAALGVLKIDTETGWSGSFTLSDCAGTIAAQGKIRSEHARWVLLDDRRSPIALPGTFGSVGSLVVDMTSPEKFGAQATIRGVRALRADEDVALGFELAESCDE